MASILSMFDIFQTNYTFSNVISSTSGKIATFIYFGLFFYLSIEGVYDVFRKEKTTISLIHTYDLGFQTTTDFYNKLNLVATLSIYAKDNSVVSDPEALLKKYLSMELSFINSNCLTYERQNFYNYKQYNNSNLLVYYTSYDINSLSDLFKLSFERQPIITDAEFDNFVNNYSIRIHLDYYYLKLTEKYYNNFTKYSVDMESQNLQFKNNGFMGYITNTRNSFSMQISAGQQTINNYIFAFNPYILNLDSNVLYSDTQTFNSFILSDIDTDNYSPSFASFKFVLTPNINTYNFAYQKISAAFASISGIMNFIRFVFYAAIMIGTFVKRHQHFSESLFDTKVNVIYSKTITNQVKAKNSVLNNNNINSNRNDQFMVPNMKFSTKRTNSKDLINNYINSPKKNRTIK